MGIIRAGERHTLITRVLHWGIVFFLILCYITAYIRVQHTTQQEAANWFLLVVHMNCGVIISLFALTAVIHRSWLSIHRTSPRAIPGSVVQYSIYTLLIMIPLFAYIGIGFDFPLFGIYKFPGIMRFEAFHHWLQDNHQILIITFMEPFAEFHRDSGTKIIMPVLIFFHISAVIYHQLMLRDRLLQTISFSR